jgi:iron complex transport system ATP-binding protein
MTSVHVEEVSVSFDGTTVLSGASVSVAAGQWLALIGPNGAGKSTLLRSIARLVPFTGTVRLGDVPVDRLHRRELARQVAFVSQRPVTPPEMQVRDYCLLGRTPYVSYLGVEGPADHEVVTATLERLDLTAFASRPLGSLSGGELQRVVLAQALAQEAPVLLLDEPTSALDVGHQQDVLELVDDLRRTSELTVLAAMHDLTLAGQFADRLLLLSRGRAVASGSAAEVLTEACLADHFGARVKVVHDEDGGVVVVPVRASAREPQRR